MENREAIGLIRQMIKDNEEDGGVEFGNKDKEALTLAISALEQERWIPVTERLPEENGRYIICYEDATTFLDYFNGKWFFPLGKDRTAWEETGTIIAWRPLPEPYTEEES